MTSDLTEPAFATAKQWRTLARLAKQLGATSATHLAALALDRSQASIRADRLTRADASKVITAGLQLVASNQESAA